MGIFDFFKSNKKDKQDRLYKNYHENGQLEFEGNVKEGN